MPPHRSHGCHAGVNIISAPSTVELIFSSQSLTLISSSLCHLADLLGREATKGRVSGGSDPSAIGTQSFPEATRAKGQESYPPIADLVSFHLFCLGYCWMSLKVGSFICAGEEQASLLSSTDTPHRLRQPSLQFPASSPALTSWPPPWALPLPPIPASLPPLNGCPCFCPNPFILQLCV